MKTSRGKSNFKKLPKNRLVAQYNEIMKIIPKTPATSQQIINLKQPSIFEEVDCITTYCTSSYFKEKNA